MKILALQAENIKRLRAVNIRPDGSVVTIRGGNGQGKTSVLDAIQFALGGKGSTPPKVIREGQDSAQVVLDLGEIIVTRKWTSNDKSYLEVRGKDGGAFRSPQAMLDKLTGTLSFDPLAFMRYEPRKQAEVLRELSGLNFDELTAQREHLYGMRTDANAEVRRLAAAVERLPMVSDAPDEEVSVAELLRQQTAAFAIRDANQKTRTAHKEHAKSVATSETRILGLQEKIATLEKELAAARTTLESESNVLDMARDAIEANALSVATLVEPDLNGIAKQLAESEGHNLAVRRKKERAAVKKEHGAAVARAMKVDQSISELDAKRKQMLSDATMPVPGLSFTEEGVLLNELPLAQASGAEQLRVSLAMGLALNPKLKVLLIRDGSLLDENSLKLVAEMAEKADAQIWLEVVGRGDETGVIIEDGEAFGPEAAQSPTGESFAPSDEPG